MCDRANSLFFILQFAVENKIDKINDYKKRIYVKLSAKKLKLLFYVLLKWLADT